VIRRVLFVDDEIAVLDGLRRMLRPYRGRWESEYVTSVDEAMQRVCARPIDAIVCDVMMPVKNGFCLLDELRCKTETRSIPVVMLTGAKDRDLKRRALEKGATDLLNKPVDPLDLAVRLTNVLRFKAYEDQLRQHNESLEELVRERTTELADSQLDLIWRLGKAAEYRDRETGNHVIRVGCYSRIMGTALNLDHTFLEQLFLASPLHDIGKIGIPDGILLKEGPLTEQELGIMQQHCVIGADILRSQRPVDSALNRHVFHQIATSQYDNPLLQLAASIALCHHERWDGRGYPRGLPGETIPIEARIVALADVYDALRSIRPYKSAFPRDRVLGIIHEEAGKHFDPCIHDVFRASLSEICDVEDALMDTVSVQAAEETVHETYTVRR